MSMALWHIWSTLVDLVRFMTDAYCHLNLDAQPNSSYFHIQENNSASSDSIRECHTMLCIQWDSVKTWSTTDEKVFLIVWFYLSEHFLPLVNKSNSANSNEQQHSFSRFSTILEQAKKLQAWQLKTQKCNKQSRWQEVVKHVEYASHVWWGCVYMHMCEYKCTLVTNLPILTCIHNKKKIWGKMCACILADAEDLKHHLFFIVMTFSHLGKGKLADCYLCITNVVSATNKYFTLCLYLCRPWCIYQTAKQEMKEWEQMKFPVQKSETNNCNKNKRKVQRFCARSQCFHLPRDMAAFSIIW